MNFPCISCGLCCQSIGKDIESARNNVAKDPVSAMLAEFPHSWDETGKCEHLGDDMKCGIYDNRPDICDISRIAEKLNIKKDVWYKWNIKSCNYLLELDGREERLPEAGADIRKEDATEC